MGEGARSGVASEMGERVPAVGHFRGQFWQGRELGDSRISKNGEVRSKELWRADSAGLAEADTEKSDEFDGASEGMVSTMEIANAEQTSDEERQ